MQRTAIVTGATGGLGPAVAQALREDGWRLVLPVLPGAPGAPEPSDDVAIVPADLMDAEDAAAVAAAAGDSLAAVVNLVGGYDGPGRVHETPVEAFEQQLRLNLRPAYLITAAALPAMLAAGAGSIVCVSSRAAVRPFSGAAGYITAKAAVLAFVDALAAEYRQDGIRANAVLPSVIDTAANRAADPDADPSGWVTPAEIAAVIRFLCSDAAGVTSGAHVPVYGRA